MQPHEQWLARAEEDLAFAQLGFRERYFAQVCFLSQQVVEKSLKAFLLAKGHSYLRLHKVIELAKLCVEIESDLDLLKIELKLLDGSISQPRSIQKFDFARHWIVLHFVRRRLGSNNSAFRPDVRVFEQTLSFHRQLQLER